MIRTAYNRLVQLSDIFLSLAVSTLLSFSLLGFSWDAARTQSTPRIHGDSSDQEGEAFSPSVQALAMTKNGVVFAGSFGTGVFRSDNQGESWESMNEGLSDRFLLCLAADAQGRVYAGTVRGGVFRTTADGQQWETISQGLKRVEVKSLLVNSNGIFAGTGRGIYRWNESLQTWSAIADELDQLLIASMAMVEDHILLAATAGKGLFRYDVSGETASKWQGKSSELVDPKERLHHRFLRIVATGKKDYIFLGTQDGGIFRSTDQGATWHTISRTLPNDSIRGIVSDDSGLYVGTGRGIYQLDEKSRRWKAKNTGLTEMAIETLMLTPDGVLYAGTSAGAFRSDNRGTNWVNISQGLGQQTLRSGPF
ncbi:ligand-binding sensor domain-containing protein [Candidatus Nitrospira salsa]